MLYCSKCTNSILRILIRRCLMQCGDFFESVIKMQIGLFLKGCRDSKSSTRNELAWSFSAATLKYSNVHLSKVQRSAFHNTIIVLKNKSIQRKSNLVRFTRFTASKNSFYFLTKAQKRGNKFKFLPQMRRYISTFRAKKCENALSLKYLR